MFGKVVEWVIFGFDLVDVSGDGFSVNFFVVVVIFGKGFEFFVIDVGNGFRIIPINIKLAENLDQFDKVGTRSVEHRSRHIPY